jgi:sulfur carrier protein ThiS
MQIKVVLFGMMREKLAKESRGRLSVDLNPGSSIHDLLTVLGIRAAVKCSVNGEIVSDFERALQDGEEVQLFQPVGGG